MTVISLWLCLCEEQVLHQENVINAFLTFSSFFCSIKICGFSADFVYVICVYDCTYVSKKKEEKKT